MNDAVFIWAIWLTVGGFISYAALSFHVIFFSEGAKIDRKLKLLRIAELEREIERLAR